MSKQNRRRPFWLPEPQYWKAYTISKNESKSKQIELQIAKKRYEIECLQIEMRYPELKTEKRKIWFNTNE